LKNCCIWWPLVARDSKLERRRRQRFGSPPQEASAVNHKPDSENTQDKSASHNLAPSEELTAIGTEIQGQQSPPDTTLLMAAFFTLRGVDLGVALSISEQTS
jgi:hypothetical protein